MGCGFTISEGCRLRLVREADAGELHASIEANRARLSPWLAWAGEQTFEDTAEFTCRCEAQVAANDGFQAVIVCDGRIAGAVGYTGVDWRRGLTTIGYWLDRDHEGRGTMTAAVRALTDHALSGWKLNRVEIRVAAGNRRSRAIPERLGFRQEGTLRQAELVGGRHLDSVVYSLLASEAGRIVPDPSQLRR